jgi:uncharacterized membrane protein YfcA
VMRAECGETFPGVEAATEHYYAPHGKPEDEPNRVTPPLRAREAVSKWWAASFVHERPRRNPRPIESLPNDHEGDGSSKMDGLAFAADPRLLVVAAAAALAGFVRGFSGFGGAMIFVPLASLAYDPKLAVMWLFVADNVASLPMLAPAFRLWRWREVMALVVGAAVCVPLGVQLLKVVDSTVLRWLICGVILLTVALLALGVRYQRRLPWPGSVGVGGLSGLAGGALGIGGPPVVLLWLGGQDNAAQMRANLVAYFALLTLATGASFILSGLLDGARFVEGLLLAPLYGLPLLLGVRVFSHAGDAHFRLAALAICAGAALLGLPVWQRF